MQRHRGARSRVLQPPMTCMWHTPLRQPDWSENKWEINPPCLQGDTPAVSPGSAQKPPRGARWWAVGAGGQASYARPGCGGFRALGQSPGCSTHQLSSTDPELELELELELLRRNVVLLSRDLRTLHGQQLARGAGSRIKGSSADPTRLTPLFHTHGGRALRRHRSQEAASGKCRYTCWTSVMQL